MTLAAVAIAVLVTLLLAGWLVGLLAAGRGIRALDHPNERSLHDTPTPRTGGLGIVAALLAGHVVLAVAGMLDEAALPVGACALLVVAISVLDDLRGLSPALRMLVHTAAAGGLVWAGLGMERLTLPGLEVALPGFASALFSVLFTVWLTNLYNFMDGIDGLAAGMGVVGFAACALLAAVAGAPALAASAAVIAVACLGFLRFNFPPARIFMGDTGASLLGFLAAALALRADAIGAFPLWITMLVFSPFVIDATVTLARRALAGERVWVAHRSHFYQRLVRLGWSHRRTTLLAYALMVACAASALLASAAGYGVQLLVLCVWSATYVMLAISVTRLERRKERHETRPAA